MSGFELVPVPGGDPIRLPPGETILGRGPLLGVSDKRVSRHHGLLENLNGRLRLKPTHLNPCFLQPSLSDEPRALQRDSWCPLGHGDLFSLLPGQFLFRVVAVGGDDRTPSHTAPCAGRDHGSPSRQEEPAAAALSDEEAASGPSTRLNMGGSTLPKEPDDDHSDVPRRRVLPAWMMSASPSLTAQSVNRSKIPAASSSNKRAAAKEAPALSEEETRPRKKARTSWTGAHCSSEGPVQNPSGPVHEVEEAEANTRKEDKEPQTTKPEPAESVGSNSGAAPASAPSPTRVRTPCPYGKDCYRKNPIHFQESSHPGDSDYEEQQEEEDRPECPYGTDCYRKNPLHRKEYKHPNKAAPATRGVTDDDSDYVPPDSDSDPS